MLFLPDYYGVWRTYTVSFTHGYVDDDNMWMVTWYVIGKNTPCQPPGYGPVVKSAHYWLAKHCVLFISCRSELYKARKAERGGATKFGRRGDRGIDAKFKNETREKHIGWISWLLGHTYKSSINTKTANILSDIYSYRYYNSVHDCMHECSCAEGVWSL